LSAGISVSVSGGIGRLTLDRPQKRNALSRAMWRAIPAAVAALDADASVRVITLQGAGEHFAAGADIAEFDEVYATRSSAAAYAADLAAAMDALSGGSKPRLALIRGNCIGGGVALAMCCDLRFAEAGARFAVTPAKLGIAYSFEDTRRLVGCVGAAAARDLLFSARVVEAVEAQQMRLIDRLYPAGTLAAEADAYCAVLASLSRGTIRVARDFIARAVAGQRGEDAGTMAAYLDILEKPDFAEGFAAFKEKRVARF